MPKFENFIKTIDVFKNHCTVDFKFFGFFFLMSL